MTPEDVINFIRNGEPWSITWEYLKKGTVAIDGLFGEGYAKEHPELLASFIQASAQNHIAESLMIDCKHITINNLDE